MLTPEQINEVNRRLRLEGINPPSQQQQPTSSSGGGGRSFLDSLESGEYERMKAKEESDRQYESTPLGAADKLATKFLGGLSKFTGVESAVDLGLSASKGLSYATDRAVGKTKEQANQQRALTAETDIEKSFREGGTKAGLKNIGGKLLEVGASALPFTKAAGVATKALSGASKLAKYGLLAGEGAVYGGLMSGAGSLQENKSLGQVAKDSLGGAVLGGVVGAGIPAFLNGGGYMARKLLSKTAQVPDEAILEMFNKPKEYTAKVRKYTNPEEKRQIVQLAEDSFKEVKAARGEAYRNALAEISDGTRITKTGPNKGTLYVKNADGTLVPTKLSLQGVKSNITQTLNQFKIMRTKNGIDFSRSPLTKSQQGNLQEMIERVNSWDDITPVGLNDLRQIIKSYEGGMEAKQYNKIVNDVASNLGEYVNKRVPAIGEMNRKYAVESDFLSQLEREIFGKNGNATESIKLMRLLKVIEEKNFLKKDLVKRLGQKSGSDLIEEITAAAMSDWFPSGIFSKFYSAGALGGGAALGGISTGLLGALAAGAGALASTSPRIVGKAARTAGLVNQVISKPGVSRYGLPALEKAINVPGENEEEPQY